MKQHLKTMHDIINHGDFITNDRSGSGMFSIVGLQEKYSLIDGSLPLVTTRKINFNKTLHELIWFIKGEESIQYLKDNKVPFWDKWTHNNSIGEMYPVIWRNLKVVSKLPNPSKENGTINYPYHITEIDQLKELIDGLEKDIENNFISRRHYLSNTNLGMRPDVSQSPTENVANNKMALDTCHREFFVTLRELTEKELEEAKTYRERQSAYFQEEDRRPLPKYRLDTCLTMRSNDVCVGKPHNVAQYATMNFILAHILNCHPGNHTHQVSDAHIYATHVDNALIQMTREPLPLPKLYLSLGLDKESVIKGELTVEQFHLENYQAHEPIKFSLEG